jgi:hypothetical protein
MKSPLKEIVEDISPIIKYDGQPAGIFGILNQETLDLFSVVLYLIKNGDKEFTGVPDESKLKYLLKKENAENNNRILDESLGRDFCNIENNGLFLDLLRTTKFFIKNFKQIYDRSYFVSMDLFYHSKNLDAKKLEDLLDPSNYKENGGHSGFRSGWMRDLKDRVNYAVFLDKRNEEHFCELWYIAKHTDKGKEKYDLIVQFDIEGISKIKHVGYEAENIRHYKMLEKYFPQKSVYVRDWLKKFIMHVKEMPDSIAYHRETEGDYIKTKKLKHKKKHKVINEAIIKYEPIVAGGAFRYILEYCCKNYSRFIELYEALNSQQNS